MSDTEAGSYHSQLQVVRIQCSGRLNIPCACARVSVDGRVLCLSTQKFFKPLLFGFLNFLLHAGVLSITTPKVERKL